jgi:hypothetical protein
LASAFIEIRRAARIAQAAKAARSSAWPILASVFIEIRRASRIRDAAVTGRATITADRHAASPAWATWHKAAVASKATARPHARGRHDGVRRTKVAAARPWARRRHGAVAAAACTTGYQVAHVAALPALAAHQAANAAANLWHAGKVTPPLLSAGGAAAVDRVEL